MFRSQAEFLYADGMDEAALITRGTVWLALVGYVVSVMLQAGANSASPTNARVFWIAGCVFFLAHVVAAFHFYHQWSHALALEDTRRQTREVTGLHYSSGIYFNYLFAIIWLIDCTGCFWDGKILSEKCRTWRIALHSFFLFMIFNATVVFGRGWARPAGLLICLVALHALWKRRRFPS